MNPKNLYVFMKNTITLLMRLTLIFLMEAETKQCVKLVFIHYSRLSRFAIEIFLDVERLEFIVRLNVIRNAVLAKRGGKRSDFLYLVDHFV